MELYRYRLRFLTFLWVRSGAFNRVARKQKHQSSEILLNHSQSVSKKKKNKGRNYEKQKIWNGKCKERFTSFRRYLEKQGEEYEEIDVHRRRVTERKKQKFNKEGRNRNNGKDGMIARTKEFLSILSITSLIHIHKHTHTRTH